MAIWVFKGIRAACTTHTAFPSWRSGGRRRWGSSCCTGFCSRSGSFQSQWLTRLWAKLCEGKNVKLKVVYFSAEVVFESIANSIFFGVGFAPRLVIFKPQIYSLEFTLERWVFEGWLFNVVLLAFKRNDRFAFSDCEEVPGGVHFDALKVVRVIFVFDENCQARLVGTFGNKQNFFVKRIAKFGRLFQLHSLLGECVHVILV